MTRYRCEGCGEPINRRDVCEPQTGEVSVMPWPRWHKAHNQHTGGGSITINCGPVVPVEEDEVDEDYRLSDEDIRAELNTRGRWSSLYDMLLDAYRAAEARLVPMIEERDARVEELEAELEGQSQLTDPDAIIRREANLILKVSEARDEIERLRAGLERLRRGWHLPADLGEMVDKILDGGDYREETDE